jgi:TetR/AcrR family transcriptional regulator, transcriptional repressor for nem operon
MCGRFLAEQRSPFLALPSTEMTHPTKQRLLEAGLSMLLEHGYNDLGIQTILAATGIPKGSFYHHFTDKEDFALQVVDEYMLHVHEGLSACLDDQSRAPLDRVRHFFELTQQKYRQEGYLGCLLGGLGQELSGVSDVFRRKIERCFSEIAGRIAVCLEDARKRGDIPADSDSRRMASLLIDCWEGAALRSRLRGSPAPLTAMLDFYFQSAVASEVPRRRSTQARQAAIASRRQ